MKYQDSKSDPKRKNLLQSLIENFSKDQKLYPESFLKSFIQRCKAPKRFKLLEKSQEKLKKELDLVKFIQSKRIQISATVGLLTPQQMLFADEFSQIVVYESSQYNHTDSSCDG